MASRFTVTPKKFAKAVEKLGFRTVEIEDSSYFIMMEFVKDQKQGSRQFPDAKLLSPCVYKKR